MMASPSQLPRCTPESQGVSSAAILRLLDALESQSLQLHSFLLARRGQIIAEGWWEPYGAKIPHELNSLTKSFTGTAIGFALAEGRLTLDTAILSLFPKEVPARPGEHLQAMQVRHLLSMTTGHASDTKPVSTLSGVRDFLCSPVPHPPGTRFIYNNGASDMLSVIVQKLTGQRVQDYLNPRLFAPLGMTDVSWETGAHGFDRGCRGMKLKTEDIARFGLLYLQQGVWNGMQLLTPYWVHEAGSCQAVFRNSPQDHWLQGYGYQFWCGSEGIYMGTGAFGQYCIVMPRHEAVVAITAGIRDRAPLEQLLSVHLLPALGSSPLPADLSAQAALHDRLISLQLRGLDGAPSSPLAPRISGRRFLLVSNSFCYKTIRFDFLAADFCRIHIVDDRGEHLFICRMDGGWQRMRTSLGRGRPEEIAVQGVWTRADTFTFRFCALEAPDCTTVTCQFDDELLRLKHQPNVGYPTGICTEIVGWCMEPHHGPDRPV